MFQAVLVGGASCSAYPLAHARRGKTAPPTNNERKPKKPYDQTAASFALDVILQVVNVILRELVQSILHLRLKAIQSILHLRLKAIQSVLDLRQALIHSIVQSCDSIVYPCNSIIHLVQRDDDIDLSKRENANNQRDKRCPQHLMIFCPPTLFGFHNRAPTIKLYS